MEKGERAALRAGMYKEIEIDEEVERCPRGDKKQKRVLGLMGFIASQMENTLIQSLLGITSGTEGLTAFSRLRLLTRRETALALSTGCGKKTLR